MVRGFSSPRYGKAFLSLGGLGWGKRVLVPGVSELAKGPPHPDPLPRWGEGINCGWGAERLESVLAMRAAKSGSV